MITDLFEELDVSPNDVIVIHGDAQFLFPFSGKTFDDKVRTFIKEIFDFIQNKGTILIPSFSYSPGREELYEPDKTETRIGGFSRLCFETGLFSRTFDPMFSWLVVGYYEKEFLNAEINTAFGEGSAFELMEKLDAKILTLGFDISKGITFVHKVEEQVGVPYRFYKKFNATVKFSEDKTESFEYTSYVRDLKDEYKCSLAKVKEEAIQTGVFKKGYLKRFPAYVTEANTLASFLSQKIAEDPYSLINGIG